MHLTNYSINKHSEGFIKASEEDQGSKRCVALFINILVIGLFLLGVFAFNDKTSNDV